MPLNEDIRDEQRRVADRALSFDDYLSRKKLKKEQEDVAQQLLDPPSSGIPPSAQEPTSASIRGRLYSLIGAFFVGMVVFFVLVSVVADFLQTHSVFAEVMTKIIVAIIGGITNVIVELIRTRK